MASITSWTRLEPRTRNPKMTGSLQAKIHDPLWMLARQWQLGEFQGEDTGSLVRSNIAYDTVTLDIDIPLECYVEREKAFASLRRSVETGLELLRLLGPVLAAKYGPKLSDHYSLAQSFGTAKLEAAGLRFYQLMNRRVPDGAKIYSDRSSAISSISPSLADLSPVQAAFEAWESWYNIEYVNEPPDTGHWKSNWMEYKAEIPTHLPDSTRTPSSLTVQEYAGGHLDWYSFDIKLSQGQTIPIGPTNAFIVLPAPLNFRGMPLPRYWAFEDADVNFGGIDAAPEDLARLVFAEFVLLYGNDFFLIPLNLPVGSLTQINQFRVTNTFGEILDIPHVRDADMKASGTSDSSKLPWQMFTLSGDPTPPLLFLAPVITGSRIESEPLEEVAFARDEMADLRWGIERIVVGSEWQPLNRNELALQGQPEQPTPPEQLLYRLYTPVPDYWIPLLQNGAGGPLQPRPTKVMGQLLTDTEQSGIYDETIPREGIKVTRSYQYARWSDGATYLWLGREKHVGNGEASSGLTFDTLSLK